MPTNTNCERMLRFVREVVSNLGRGEADGQANLIVFHFLYPFRLEFAKHNVGKNIEFYPQDINSEEFQLLVKIYRNLAQKMPDVFYIQNTAIVPTDFSGKVVGWHNLNNLIKHGPKKNNFIVDPFEIETKEVLQSAYKLAK
jgi:hypothetical protein